jgi:hypothetical protein
MGDSCLVRIFHHRVPLLETSRARAAGYAQHDFCEAVAHCCQFAPCGEKCGLALNIESSAGKRTSIPRRSAAATARGWREGLSEDSRGVGCRSQDRSRSFPPKAVLGPAFTFITARAGTPVKGVGNEWPKTAP